MAVKVLSAKAVEAEIARVAEALAKKSLSRERRLELLRRQAALGDLRDELITRARRDAYDDKP